MSLETADESKNEKRMSVKWQNSGSPTHRDSLLDDRSETQLIVAGIQILRYAINELKKNLNEIDGKTPVK